MRARFKRCEMVNLILAYAVIAVLLTAYITNIVLRTRKLNRALQEEN